MITNKTKLREVLKYEKKLYNVSLAGYILSFFGVSEQNIIWRYQKRLRIWEYHYNSKHKLMSAIYHFLTVSLGYRYGFSIGINCIEKGLKIMHIGQIIINSKARIGEDCLINSGVSIVSSRGEDSAPVIGSKCKLGIGCTIVGSIVLPNNTIVGAGSVVVKSFFEENITIAGVPAKIISRSGKF